MIDDFAALELHGIPGQTGEWLHAIDKRPYQVLTGFHRAVIGARPVEANTEEGYWATWCAQAPLRSLPIACP